MSYCFGDPDMVRKPRPADWTPQEVEHLRALAKSGILQTAAAVELGRTLAAVDTKCQQHGIRWRKDTWTAADVERLRALVGTATMPEIAERLGRGVTAVAAKASRLGITPHRHGEKHQCATHANAQISEIILLWDKGWTNRQIADHLGVACAYVWDVTNFRHRYRESLPAVLAQP